MDRHFELILRHVVMPQLYGPGGLLGPEAVTPRIWGGSPAAQPTNGEFGSSSTPIRRPERGKQAA